MIEDRAEENLVVDLNNLNQEQVQEEQVFFNLIQDTMRMR
jgi:hypothetical protein